MKRLSGVVVSMLWLSARRPGLVFNDSREMTPDQMLHRADLVFVGVVKKHQFDSEPWFRPEAFETNPDARKYWKVLRRQVTVEMVLKGREHAKVIDVFEISWTGAQPGTGTQSLPVSGPSFWFASRTIVITCFAIGGATSSRSLQGHAVLCRSMIHIRFGSAWG